MAPTLERNFLTRFVASFLLLTAFCLANAQVGGSTSGAARTRYLGSQQQFPTSREVAVEEFVNYHRHEIATPKAGEAVALDVRWGSSTVEKNGESVLQIGLSTAFTSDRAQLRPVNLSLVIDKSGSMAANDKLVRVKQALQTLVSHLRDTDTLSIVVFDSEAQVLLPAQPVRDRESIREAIAGIQPGSATNLNAGLVLGYQEVMKHFRNQSTNRVILLTDGITNHGETDSTKIAQGSLAYNDKGIDLSTIGVGLDLNEDLLRQLAKSGRGLYHFVADSQDIDKVFSKEVQSLISPVASEPNLHVEFGPELRLDKVFGYTPRIGKGSVDIRLDNMNSGLTEVVLMRFKPAAGVEGVTPVKVKLTYQDLLKNKEVVKTDRTSIGSDGEPSLDASVAKNYSIAILAQAIHDMASACEESHFREAESVLNVAIDRTHRRYPNSEDEDIRRALSTAEKYQAMLQTENRSRGEREGERAENLLANGNFSLGNRGFTSDLAYTAPGENCLWSAGYTVAPRWNAPLLHRLFARAEYAAPVRSTGDEQVLFANAGGTTPLVLWSAEVACKPHTLYEIRFKSLSLSGQREDIPNFEIRANESRSSGQAAGYGQYGDVRMVWNSENSTSASLSIVRMAQVRNGGLVAVCNIEMIPVR